MSILHNINQNLLIGLLDGSRPNFPIGLVGIPPAGLFGIHSLLGIQNC